MTEPEAQLRHHLHRLAGHAHTTPTRPLNSPPLRTLPPTTARPATRRTITLLAAAAFITVVGAAAALTLTRSPATTQLTTDSPNTDTGAGIDRTDTSTPATGLARLLEPGAARPMAAAPIASRSGAAAVWTGDELLIWGGSFFDGRERAQGDGVAYNPATDTWRMLPDAPIAGRAYAASAWTGDELLIWGGSDAGRFLGDGAAYNPATDSWRTLPPAPIGPAMKSATVWTGTELIIAGGLNAKPDVATYNPTTNTWTLAERAPGNQTPPYPRAVWGEDRAYFLTLPFLGGPAAQVELATYDPDRDTWSNQPTPLAGIPHLFWTGEELLALSSATAMAYDPDTHQWRDLPVPASNALDGVWTGQHAVFYDWADTLRTYDPARSAWTRTNLDLLPALRSEPVVVWADGIILVWGGPPLNPDPSGQRPDPGGFLARPLDPATAPPDTNPPDATIAVGIQPPNTTAPFPGAVNGRIPVAGNGTTGYILEGMPPATINGRPVPLTKVYDANDIHIGYFACRYFPKALVEDPATDPFTLCDNTATTAAG